MDLHVSGGTDAMDLHVSYSPTNCNTEMRECIPLQNNSNW